MLQRLCIDGVLEGRGDIELLRRRYSPGLRSVWERRQRSDDPRVSADGGISFVLLLATSKEARRGSRGAGGRLLVTRQLPRRRMLLER